GGASHDSEKVFLPKIRGEERQFCGRNGRRPRESRLSTIPTCWLLCRAWICCSNPPEGLPILHAAGLVHRWKSKRNRCWLVRRKRRISRYKRARGATFLSGKYRKCGVGCCKRSVFYDIARAPYGEGQWSLGPAFRYRARARPKT